MNGSESKGESHAASGVDGASRFDPSRGEVFGIECEHHYGITTHPMPKDSNVANEVYRLLREAWHVARDDGGGLHDDNHTWEINETESEDGWSRVVIRKNEKSPPFLFNPWWVDDGPGALWFSQNFRVATRGLIEREIGDRLKWAERWDENAARQRDSVRGRKARAKYTSLANSSRCEAKLIRSRWPEFDGSPRTGWQERMHCHRDPARGPKASPTLSPTPTPSHE